MLQIGELAGDNRLGIIALLFVPVVGWVGFNILQPALNQLDAMSGGGKAPKKAAVKKRSIAAGLGLMATMLAAQNADAATEVHDLEPIPNSNVLVTIANASAQCAWRIAMLDVVL